MTVSFSKVYSLFIYHIINSLSFHLYLLVLPNLEDNPVTSFFFYSFKNSVNLKYCKFWIVFCELFAAFHCDYIVLWSCHSILFSIEEIEQLVLSSKSFVLIIISLKIRLMLDCLRKKITIT